MVVSAGDRLREELASLGELVLAQEPAPTDLHELLRRCIQHLGQTAKEERDAAAARAKQEKATAKAEKEALAAATAGAKAAERAADEAEAVALRAAAKEAERSRAAADAALEKAKAHALGRARAEEKATSEADGATRAAEEAAKAAALAAAAAEEAALEARREENAMELMASDEQEKVVEAARKRATKAQRELEKANERRRKAEERSLRAAELLAERAKEKAAAALDVARATASRVRELGGGTDATPFAEKDVAALSPASHIAAQRLRRASDRLERSSRSAAAASGGGADEPRVMIRYDDANAALPTTAAEALELEREAARQRRLLLGDDDEGQVEEGNAGSVLGGGFSGGLDGVVAEDAGDSNRERSAASGGAEESVGVGDSRREWLEAWYGGGERGYELPGFIPRQSDCVALSGKSTCVCAGGDGAGDGLCVSIYDLTKGSIECHLHGHMERVVSIACDGDLIASGSRDGEIRLWTQPRRGASTGAPDGGGSGADHGGTHGGASSADGGAAGGLLATLKGCEGAVYGLALRGDVLFSGEAAPDMNPSRVAKARLWSVSQRACVATFTEHKGNVRGACGQSDAHTPVAYLQQTAQHDL